MPGLFRINGFEGSAISCEHFRPLRPGHELSEPCSVIPGPRLPRKGLALAQRGWVGLGTGKGGGLMAKCPAAGGSVGLRPAC